MNCVSSLSLPSSGFISLKMLTTVSVLSAPHQEQQPGDAHVPGV